MDNQKHSRMKKNIWILLILAVFAVMVSAGVWFVLHEKAQNLNITALMKNVENLTYETEDQAHTIKSLSDAVETLSERINRKDDRFEPVEWGTGYNWFALGNSLTWIESWGRGICSTQPDNDYFGLVKAYLETKYDDVTAKRLHYGVWEQSPYRNAMFDYIDPYLSPDLDLVTIQLGENVADIYRPVSNYKTDLAELVDYIRERCPSAQVIMIDDFWNDSTSEIRRKVAEETGIEFADLTEIRGKKEYQSEAGTVYYLPNGKTKTVTEEAAAHPGDSGMAYIADRVIEKITIK